jgi:hypothetical protein
MHYIIHSNFIFCILLTVHLDIILVNDVPVKTGTSDSHPPECVIPDDVLIQYGPPDDEHLCLKHVEAENKYIKKKCVKLVINQNNI